MENQKQEQSEKTSSPESPTKSESNSVCFEWGDILQWCGVPPYYAKRQIMLDGNAAYDKIGVLMTTESVPHTVYCYGDVGNGKTHMGTVLFSYWLARMKQNPACDATALWTTATAICEAAKNYGAEAFDRVETLNKYIRPSLVMIDDLFVERTTEADTDVLANIIAKRINLEKRTIITSNRSLIEVRNDFSRRLGDRLLEGEVVYFDGDSHRLKTFAKK